MKRSIIIRLLSAGMSIILCMTGCGAYQTEPAPATYYHIDSEREYQTALPTAPKVEASYADQYAVLPKEGADTLYSTNVCAQLCINNTENTVVASEMAFEKIYPASMTKIMTALLVLERGTLTDTVTVTEAVELSDPAAVSLGLEVGDTITVDELMHALLLMSANDAAVVLGRYIAGSEESFVTLMNERAAQLGATHTHFVNSNGLHSGDHYTTAYDLYLIFQELLTHDEFRQISGLSDYTLHYTTLDDSGESATVELTLQNSNQFLTGVYEMPEGMTVLNGKTGTTDEAGYCLILEAEDANQQRYIAIVCGSPSRSYLYAQMKNLLVQTQSED